MASLVMLVLMASLASASHFYGGSNTFTARGRNPDGTFRVVIRSRVTFDGSHYSSPYNRCYRGNCGNSSITQRGRIDSGTNAVSRSRRWSEGETVVTTDVPSNKPFEIRYASCCWIDHRSWSLLTHVDLGTRSDTGKPNNSPDITILSFLRVPVNCPRSYNLMTFDPDGDQVRCRYGTAGSVECGHCTQPTGFRLDQGSCTLHYGTSSSQSTGIRRFELVVEDFPRRHITLAYTDGSQSSRSPLQSRARRRRRSHQYTTALYPWWWNATTPGYSNWTTPPAVNPWWWWWGQTTAPPTSTTPPTTPGYPWWWWGQTTAAATPLTTTTPPTTTGYPWWWSWQTTAAATPPTTTTPPPSTTGNPWWWWGQTTAPPTSTTPPTTTGYPWWWWGQTTAAATPPTTTTPPPSTTANPWWWWGQTTAAVPPLTTTTPPPSTTGNPWWWWRPRSTPPTTTTPPPSTTGNPWWWRPSSPPPTTTTPPTTTGNPWWWWRPRSTPPTTTTPPPSTTGNPWWWRQTTAPTTTPPTSTTRATTPSNVPWWVRPSTTTRQVTTTTDPLYNSTPPLSKLPLHFAFLVDPAAPSCVEGEYLPRLLHPTPRNGEQLQAEVNKETEIRVKAQATRSTVYDMVFSGPLNVTKHRTTHDEFVIRWTPVPDDVGQYFPICFVVEASYGSSIYQSEMRCVVVQVGLKIVKANVICNETAMTVEVDKSSVKGLIGHLRLNEANNIACSLDSQQNSTHIIAVVPLSGCGTQIEEDDYNLIFKNAITTVDDTNDLITRKHLLEVEFYCQYPKTGNVTLSFTAHRSNVTVKEKGFGTFTYQFEFFHSQRFTSMMDPRSYPLEYDVGDKIYIQIEASSSVNDTELFVESCRAAPYDNPSYRPTYSIIEHGCAVDHTVVVLSPRHEKHFQFSMDAFKFIGMHDQVYISCSVILCEAGNPKTRCSQGCINSTQSRKKREAVIQTARHYISQGPLRLRRSPETTATNLNMNLVFIAGCLLTAIAMICAVAIYKVRKTGVKYELLPSTES